MSKRKYVSISKVGYDSVAKQPICVKYRFNNIDNFLLFIQNKYPALCWINIFLKDTGKLKYTWGKKKGLQESNK